MLHHRICALSVMLFIVRCDSFSMPPQSTARQARTRRSPRLSSATDTLPEGLTKSIERQGSGPPVSFGDICTLSYSCYVVDDIDADADDSIPFAKSKSQKYMVGDGSMIDAWEKVIPTMRVGERSIIRVNDPKLAYGSNGVPPIVPLELLDAQAATTNIDFDSLALAEKTPTTAAEIQAAFEKKLAAKSDEPKLEGFELFLKKAQSFYFFGIFEGETGQRPPWFLRPSITFPLAFAIVGAAFYVSIAGGAISERGAQVKDELDEVILTMNGADRSVGSVMALTAFVAANVMDLGL
jgi:hypothetical protein